jgi:hypothetical protein
MNINNKLVLIIDFVNCCKMKQKQKYKYVKHEDDINYRNNIMFDLKGINFAPEIQWIDCDLYEY